MTDLRKKVNIDPTYLMNEYGPDMYRFCCNLAFTKEDGEDLFQDTFLKLLEKPQKLTNGTELRQVLCSPALSIWKDRKRKYARRKRIAPCFSLEKNDIGAEDVEEDFLFQEEKRLVRHLVDVLPEKYRLPTVLYYSSEMKITEIAKLLKLPEGTVKFRLFTARKLVRKGLMDHDK